MNQAIEVMMDLLCLKHIQQCGNEEERDLTMKIACSIPEYDFLDDVTAEDVLKYLEKKYL